MTMQLPGCTLDYVYQYLDKLNFACAVFDQEERLLWWNQRATDVTGYPSLGLCESDILGLFKAPHDASQCCDINLKHANGHHEIGHAQIQCKNGEFKDVLLHHIPLGHEADEIPAIALMFIEED